MNPRRSLLILTGTLTLALGLPSGEARAERVEIQATRLTVRSGPGTEHKRIGSAPKGRVYEVLARKGAWVQIRHASRKGWVYGRHVRTVTGRRPTAGGRPVAGMRPASTGARYRVNASRLNVRVKPGLKAKIRFRLRRGTEVSVLATQGDWRRIQHRGRKGWVMGKFLVTPEAPPPRRRVRKRRRPVPRRKRPRPRK